MYQDNDFGQETYDAVIDQLSSMNLTLHEKATNKPTDTDLTSQITKLKNADCEAVAIKEYDIEVSHGEIYDLNQIIRPSKPEYNDLY